MNTPADSGWTTAIRAGIAYFAIIFAAGFVLGTIRTLGLAPRIGAPAAVLVELPFMLVIAWVTCRWLVSRLAVAPASGPRLAMGIVAFVLLMAAELALSVLLFGGTVPAFADALRSPEGLLGLAGQVAFAAMPLFAGRS
jgi:hypothetical protein